MGQKIVKDTKETSQPSIQTATTPRGLNKTPVTQAKSKDLTVDPKPKITATSARVVKSTGTLKSSSENTIKKKNEQKSEKINVNADPNKLKDENVRSSNIRVAPKKAVAVAEMFTSKESQLFKIVKKQNKNLEDSSLIDNIITKHFFMRVLDKQSR
jgi:hypothetical protein